MAMKRVLQARSIGLSLLRDMLAAAATTLATFVTGRKAGTYDPSRHYMRGPGPKWIARHGPVPRGRGHTA